MPRRSGLKLAWEGWLARCSQENVIVRRFVWANDDTDPVWRDADRKAASASGLYRHRFVLAETGRGICIALCDPIAVCCMR
jgi:hypothetical protein